MDRNQTTGSGHYRQPARSLLIDLSPPFSQNYCREICAGLENLLSMVCSLSGQSRVPFLSISTLGAFPEILLPIQHVRGNFPRIQCAVEEIQRVFCDNQSVSTKLSDSCLLQALEDVCTQFKRQTKMMLQTSGQWSQLEIVVISGQNSIKLSKQIERLTASLNLENLRRIQVVSLTDDMMIVDEGGMDPGTGSQKSSHSEGSSECAGLGILVDSIQIDCDSLSIQSYFNSWLKEVATDREHLHIRLPSPSAGCSPMILKCDLQERIINPQLLHGLSLSLHKEPPPSAAPKPNQQGGGKSAEATPIYELSVEKMLPSTALCESIIFGMPLIVQPTTCWKIDWEELEQNQQDFQSLCQTLSEKDAVLLGSCFMSGFKQKTAQFDVTGFSAWFVILPARNSLLIKSLAVNELMLPCNEVFQTDKPSDGSKTRVTESLEKVEMCEMYNPLLTTSGMYNVLKSQYRKPIPNKQPRRKFNYQPKQADVPDGRGGHPPGANLTFKRFCPPGSITTKSTFPTEL